MVLTYHYLTFPTKEWHLLQVIFLIEFFFLNIVLQVVGMCVLVTLVESTMIGSSRCQAFISNWRIVKYYKRPWQVLEVLDAHLFFIHDVTYPVRPYLQKTWKTHNPNDVNKIWYVSSLNFERVAFESLKNRWHILKHLNSRVDKVLRIVFSYVLHNGGVDFA
jgi:hypothetical protein